jgi:hypothetical protein
LPYERRIQLLWCALEIETDDEVVHDQLAYMDHAAEQSIEPTTTVHLRARKVGDAYHLERDGTSLGTVDTAQEVFVAFFTTGYLAAFAAMPADAIVFHGVTIAAGHQRVLLIGPSGTGKSTVAAHLVANGVDVLGDEYAVLIDDELTALPRRFHLKPGSLPLLPELRDVLDRSPLIADSTGRWARSFDPADVGRPRVIAGGHLRAVVEVVPNHGGATTLETTTQVETAARLMAQTFVPAGPPGPWIDRLCRALRDTTTHRLVLGDLDAALVALQPLVR